MGRLSPSSSSKSSQQAHARLDAPRLGDLPDNSASRFFCEIHQMVRPFQLQELRTQVFDTYAICGALLTTMSSARFFFDNRDPSAFLTGNGWLHTTVTLTFLLQHLHLLVCSICTVCGMECMMVFVLTAMYSRSALALPQVGAGVFEFFLNQTGRQRIRAFGFMLASGILSSINLIVMCLAMPTGSLTTDIPGIVLDVVAILSGCIVFCIAMFTVREVWTLVRISSIIFAPIEKLDEFADQLVPLLEEGTTPPLSARSQSHASATPSA